jgi:hypothetical protein
MDNAERTMKTFLIIVAIAAAGGFVLVKIVKDPVIASPAVAGDAHGASPKFQPRLTRGQRTIQGPDRGDQIRTVVSQLEKAITSADELNDSLRALVDLDPAAAAELMAKMQPGDLREQYLLRLAQLWAAQDPAAALQWASILQDDTERVSATGTVCLEMAQANPEAAIHALEKLGMSHDKSTLDNLAQLWATRDISAAAAWALARPGGDARDSLVARVAFVMSETNPSEAANLVVNSVPAGELQSEAAISIVHRWALRDWKAAQEWVDRFPQGPLRQRAQAEIAGSKDYRDGIKAAAK